MRIFLDTANIEEIRKAAKLGIVSGVTTNPSLLSHEGKSDYKSSILEICSIIDGPISVEVLSQDAEEMVKEARQLASWADNVVVKIPVIPAGIEAISVLSKEGINQSHSLFLC